MLAYMAPFGDAVSASAHETDVTPAHLLWVSRLHVLGFEISKGTGVRGKKCGRFPLDFSDENWDAWRGGTLFLNLGV
jgi:hypothetical protein